MTTYRLIDFGGGQKYESLGEYRVVRPSPAALGVRPAFRWERPEARFDAATRKWQFDQTWPAGCRIRFDGFHMPAIATPFGHLGFFPEQQLRWRQMIEWSPIEPGDRALNLFAYTGAATLALAIAGYQVAHVDAAKPNVALARSAAESNDLGDRPIRWLVDDAQKFVDREIRRGRDYRVVVLDPPAYGHGPRGNAWRLSRDLEPLLAGVLRLMMPGGRLVVSGHDAEMDQDDLRTRLRRLGPSCRPDLDWRDASYDGDRLTLSSESGRTLDAGYSLAVTLPMPE